MGTFIVVIIGIIIVFFLLKKTTSLREFAKGIAKTQLATYQALKSKNPIWTKEKLYRETIKSRPGFDNKECDEIIREAKEALEFKYSLNGNKTAKSTLSLADIVASLIIYEHTRIVGLTPIKTDIGLIAFETVEKIIPEDY